MEHKKTPHFTIRFKHSSDEEDVFVVDNHGIILSGGKNKVRKRAQKRNLNKEIMQLSKEKEDSIDDNVDLNIQNQNMADNDNVNQFYDPTCINPFITYNNQPGIFVPIYSAPQVVYPGPPIIYNKIPNTPFVYNQIPNPPILITKASDVKQGSSENIGSSGSSGNSNNSGSSGNSGSSDNSDSSGNNDKLNETPKSQ